MLLDRTCSSPNSHQFSKPCVCWQGFAIVVFSTESAVVNALKLDKDPLKGEVRLRRLLCYLLSFGSCADFTRPLRPLSHMLEFLASFLLPTSVYMSWP